jgi:hypothetical protein
VSRTGEEGSWPVTGASWSEGHEERLVSPAVWGGGAPQALDPAAVRTGPALGLCGLRDSWNAGLRAGRRANAISPISDLEAQIWKFEEAQPALPNCKET